MLRTTAAAIPISDAIVNTMNRSLVVRGPLRYVCHKAMSDAITTNMIAILTATMISIIKGFSYRSLPVQLKQLQCRQL